ncbi:MULTISPECIES: O-acetylhomoserine aminocarboxypropyltransferase/cysteine synthase family protein [Gammaproteobacteria]|uniref:O-acetylhomoserine aminocarboxypropyltransferase/cysteine synthase family protein n=1 Tax=Gammaproteobacteria TaxID=1236 RepID=UPI000DD0156C|nr:MULTISPECIES: aminotransferase class I/II-fold pyridoxal phosphate-dependent enzyme [Gammaproteobacteria]RTE87368.1 aminotransferase class I/II-fold pyridoxal phosphate-dependent enzyme [Aliidiomarina sp. B3213]TCZ92846.1 aminotransferase class I/II-fold pyridoxal phosphate-dependent enzyme [Lysobacter sp. N42]
MKPETIALHFGYEAEKPQRSAAVPIYQTTSFTFDNTAHGADLFNLQVEGNIYSRIMNPTNAVLEQRLAALEGGIGALAVSSGMAAITYTVQTLARAGDNIVSVSQLYGGTYNLFAHTLPQQGIEVRFVNGLDVQAIASLIDENTKLIFCESIGNPAGNVVDIAALSEIANQHGVALVVDNTVATPALCKPFEHGAHIVVHSLTKYIGGHGTTVGGAIVDSGTFPWQEHKVRYPQLNEPDPSYHGVVYTEALGEAAFIGRARVVPLRNTGACLAAQSAFQILQGLETLSLRIEKHCANTKIVANYLQQHPGVAWVNYAGLEDSPYHELATRFTKGTAAGILSFGIKGGEAAAQKFIDALHLILRLVNIGDAKSLACHPASTTHRQLSDSELESAGVTRDLVRLSIGIEHPDDIIADIDQALTAAQSELQPVLEDGATV